VYRLQNSGGGEDKVECGIVENNKTKAKTNWKGIGTSVSK
jgi:hypothetical protein